MPNEGWAKQGLQKCILCLIGLVLVNGEVSCLSHAAMREPELDQHQGK